MKIKHKLFSLPFNFPVNELIIAKPGVSYIRGHKSCCIISVIFDFSFCMKLSDEKKII